MMRGLVMLSLPSIAAGHAAMVEPKPRNAADGSSLPWSGPVPDFDPVSRGWPTSAGNWCPIGAGGGSSTGENNSAYAQRRLCCICTASRRAAADRLSGANGQSCFWFSQGCSIGCGKCLPEDQRCPGPSHSGSNTDVSASIVPARQRRVSRGLTAAAGSSATTT